MSQLDARPTGDQEVAVLIHIGSSFVAVDLEIFSRVILSRPLIQEGQWLVSGKKILCTILINRLED